VQVVKSRDQLTDLAQLHLRHDRDMLGLLRQAGGVTYQDMQQAAIVPAYADLPAAKGEAGEKPEMKWSVNAAGRGLYSVTSTQARVYTGHASQFEEATAGQVRIVSPEFVAMTVTALDNREMILVTACGRCENTGMQFSEDRRTVGRNWGQAPVRIEPVEGRLALPAGRWKCDALAPDGSLRQSVPISYEAGRGVLHLAPEYATMWYLLRRGE